MNMLIRQMQPEDVDAVRELDAQAFTPYLRRTGRGDSCPVRSRESVLSFLARNPSGCFVAEIENLLGYVFTREWGDVGWIGTFGVDPSHQGKGIGHRLLDAAVQHLQDSNCAMIGLETMPDNIYNVGFYSAVGFRPEYSTLLLCKDLNGEIHSSPFATLGDVGRKEGLAAVSAISSSAMPGLDYASEAGNALDFGWGETVFLGWPAPWACAILRSEGSVAHAMPIVIRPEARCQLDNVIEAVTSWASARDLAKLIIPISTADPSTMQCLLANKFRTSNVVMRMMFKGSYTCPRGIDMSRWAM